MRADRAALLRQVRAAIKQCDKQLDLLAGGPHYRDATWAALEKAVGTLRAVETDLAGTHRPEP